MTTLRPAGDRDAEALAALVPGPDRDGVHVVEHDGAVVGAAYLRPSPELPGGALELGWQVRDEHAAAVAELLGAGLASGNAVFALVPGHDVARRRFAERLGFTDAGGGVLVAVRPSGVHHVELWVAGLATARKSFGWLFTELGWCQYQRWDRGVSWRHGESYVVVEDSAARTGTRHDRTAPGINHLALHAGTRADVDRIAAAAPEHGWTLMFADRHPYAGGQHHYAAYLENTDGFEVELVATR